MTGLTLPAHTPAHPPVPGPAPHVGGATAGDSLINTVTTAAGHVLALSPAELAVNMALSAAIVAIALGLVVVIHRLVNARLEALAKAEADIERPATRALRWVRSCARAGLAVGAIYLVLVVWGFDPIAWWVGAGGRAFLRLIGRLALLAVIFVGALEFAGVLIRRTMGNLVKAARDPRRAAQLRTLSPLLRGVVQAVILVFGLMMVLSELGVQIGPLIAGAGVAGIAIGFGAQSLVKDVLTGFFLIIEDIVSVGDTVRIATCKGEVESMTLRTIRLRDFDGSLHIFPYGEAQVIHNETKAFSYAVVDLQISYGSDVDAALVAMADVGSALQRDPILGPKILADMEVLGVENLKESGLQLRGRIKTRTGADGGITREFNRRIKAEFDSKGINISYPQMRLVLPEGPESGESRAAKSP
jgi:small conductance mechanosensitive channel